ncbi:MAG: DNA double-strand break repair nuclease NurA [Promethearchaeia archaeon]
MTIREDFEFSSRVNPSPLEEQESGSTKEQLLLKNLKNLTKEYINIEKIKKRFVTLITEQIPEFNFSQFIENPHYDIKEACLIHKVKKSNIRGLNIVSVDGSSVIKNFLNVDFSFLKTIAVIYQFRQNHSANIKYYPDLNGFNNYQVKANYINRFESSVESELSMNMKFMELNLLNKLIEEDRTPIDLIIIDGSIVIMPINYIFSKDKEVLNKYNNLLLEYKRLYKNCKKKGILLVGSIKDTRSSALTHLLRDSIQLLKPQNNNPELMEIIKMNYRTVMEYFNDVDLFNRILSKGERSCIFQCKREQEMIRDTGIKKDISYHFPLDFYAYYFKTAKYDTPCRIEFFTDEEETINKAAEKAQLISSILLPVSNLNESFGLPIPQIEAHKRAVFKKHEINLLFRSLNRNLSQHGINLVEKRRNRRPF